MRTDLRLGIGKQLLNMHRIDMVHALLAGIQYLREAYIGLCVGLCNLTY